ncbi:CYFA0S22e00782g1_1 [Cyberlindnera fabianii]|uniref:Cytoplasmic tRNA 2-thiolation protein 2 n=1 Tax=Cyberlindnera fabianii TaxID=36022 RepID=A0A061BGP1_CYBFA|nr:CYFA0S22e00782g1_1 [Cyberlindnera fabianii]
MTSGSIRVCSRCKTEPAVILSRKELFCGSCFIRFISGKQRRHMGGDKFKVRFGTNIIRENVVFPCSFGKSSLVLLDIIFQQFNEQLKNPRVWIGFHLDVVFVDDGEVSGYKNDVKEIIEDIKKEYDTERFPVSFTIIPIDAYSQGKQMKRILVTPEFETLMNQMFQGEAKTVTEMLRIAPNRASRDDLQKVVIQELIMSHVIEQGATALIWGHNMSSLAGQVLALTVKGRGSEIHRHLTDYKDEIAGKEIDVIHPLRDVSQGEVEKFIKFRKLEKLLLITTQDSSKLMNKQKTVDEVVLQYYDTVDTADDNIVSTVVRTGAKLAEPKNYDGVKCIVCGGKIYNDPKVWLRDITYHGHRGPETELEKELLKEWEANQKINGVIRDSDDFETRSMCYGCIVTVGGHAKSTITWPVRTDMAQKKEILDEFVIDEEDD